MNASPAALGLESSNWRQDEPLMRGGNGIIGPLGDILAGPIWHETALVTAVVDLRDMARTRYDFDVVGDYFRPDVFRLTVDETPRHGVTSLCWAPRGGPEQVRDSHLEVIPGAS
jgi:nitrilase